VVAEERGRAAVAGEHLGRLLEQLIAWVLDLAELVAGVLAVFADQEHRIDRELVPSAPQRRRDAGIDGEPELFFPGSAQVAVRGLIDIRGDDLDRRAVPPPPYPLAAAKPLAPFPRAPP